MLSIACYSGYQMYRFTIFKIAFMNSYDVISGVTNRDTHHRYITKDFALSFTIGPFGYNVKEITNCGLFYY